MHDLFGFDDAPAGLVYQPEVLSVAEEAQLLGQLAELPFAPFEFHGFEGKRRVVSFGWKYDFSAERIREAEPMPGFLADIRARVVPAVGRAPEAFGQVLVTEYGPGAGIGWHKDKAVYDEIIGLSLGASCTLRLRQRQGTGWRRWSRTLEPRSAYLFSGEVRSAWEHSIPPVTRARFSLTYRSLA
jgi:alkylated DNA repair dioxygenase AlkB